MAIGREFIEELIFGFTAARRFTQDSPILPDVWIEYGRTPGMRIDLLLTPHRVANSGELAAALRERLRDRRAESDEADPHGIGYTQGSVVAALEVDELIRAFLPLTGWWQEYVAPILPRLEDADLAEEDEGIVAVLGECVRELGEGGRTVGARPERPTRGAEVPELSAPFVWLVQTLGVVLLVRDLESDLSSSPPGTIRSRQDLREAVEATAGGDTLYGRIARAALACIAGAEPAGAGREKLAWMANLNRSVELALYRSVRAVKADAALRVFDVSCENMAWAVIDSGIDATHPAFRSRKDSGAPYPAAFEEEDGGGWINRTRVEATYDFTRIRNLLNPASIEAGKLPDSLAELLEGEDEKAERARETLEELRRRLLVGREVDWGMLEPLLRVEHDDTYTDHAAGDHGTHVAGIIGADWREDDADGTGTGAPIICGICPDIKLYDLRVLDPAGGGDEFAVIAALQFVRHLNARSEHVVLHGVNLSISIPHDVANYACGRTPVCEESERVAARGIFVVAAAGNQGYQRYQTARGFKVGYHTISITDPGNAESVLTVGATHRFQPHTYGVSYFSSRGPTGDGRIKPDLVAPGEKIVSSVPGDTSDRMDGTSMAAPHASGVAALLMARHTELIGQPDRVKEILCTSATDLGREHYFQGAGMLDALRALQTV